MNSGDPVVACVLRTGGDYTGQHVAALKAGLEHHAPGTPLVCLTDAPDVPADWRVPLIQNWRGWWSKIELFRPGLFSGPVLYIDLDSLIVGDLTDLLAYRGGFAMLNDFYQGRRLAASGVMAWTPSQATAHIYEALTELPKPPGGRSDFFYRKVAPPADRLQELFPGQLVSFKKHAQNRREPPPGARIVCFHGRPRPQDAGARWGRTLWLERVREGRELMEW